MEQSEQELHFSIAGIHIRLLSSRPLTVSSGLGEFLTPAGEGVTISLRPLEGSLPPSAARLIGEDLHFFHYFDGRYFYSVAKPGTDGSVSTAFFTPDFTEAALLVNEGAFPNAVTTADKALQLFPLWHLLLHYRGILLHSSRVFFGGKAIVFSAPSQTGKTTQARLWQRYAGAEIVSNDKSILRQEDGGFFTYGYPIDGSSPVFDSRRIPLGAVVMLAQGMENRVERISTLPAVRCLMEQTVCNPLASPGEVSRIWLDLAAEYPVYRLTCRPDNEAVFCLKDRLIRDGVISNG